MDMEPGMVWSWELSGPSLLFSTGLFQCQGRYWFSDEGCFGGLYNRTIVQNNQAKTINWIKTIKVVYISNMLMTCNSLMCIDSGFAMKICHCKVSGWNNTSCFQCLNYLIFGSGRIWVIKAAQFANNTPLNSPFW